VFNGVCGIYFGADSEAADGKRTNQPSTSSADEGRWNRCTSTVEVAVVAVLEGSYRWRSCTAETLSKD